MQKTLTESIPRLAPILQEELERAERFLKPARFAKGEFFCRVGERQTRIAFVERGLFRVFYLQEDGSEATRAFIREGGFLAVRVSMVRNERAPFSIEALEDSDVLFMPGDANLFAEVDAKWGAFMASLMQERLDYKDRRIQGFLTKDAAGRYRDFLTEYPGLEDRVRQHHVASYLGITPVTLSRIRARLRRQGLLPRQM